MSIRLNPLRLKSVRLEKRHALGALVIVAVLGAYQNCAQAPDGTTNADGSASSSSAGEDYDDALPFAYDVKVDTIAYMSCSEISKDKNPGAVLMNRAYFSFRAGAYNSTTGGIALTPAFRGATQYFSSEERARTLASSALNGNTRLTMSMRSRTNLNQYWSQGEGLGRKQASFLPPMDAAEVAGPLAASVNGLASTQSRYLNYFPSGLDKRLMEASLNIWENHADADSTRKYLSGTGDLPIYLVAGFGATSDELAATFRQPVTYAADRTTVVATPATKAYGTGFSFLFGLPTGVSVGETRVLSSVGEYDLSIAQPKSASWECPTSYQFMIVRPEDVEKNPALCFTGPDQNVSADAGLQSAQNAIRRVLRAEDWYVDVTRHCVVPKNTGDVCYGSYGATTAIYQPLYNSAQCRRNNTAATAAIPAGTTCPHYVSVCLRR